MQQFTSLSEWLAWQEHLHPRPIDLGLDRVRRVLQRLCPEPRWPFTITVAGTNGKGSSVAYLDAILRAEGYRVGAYTSPHLLRYNERIAIDGQAVDDETICRSFARIEAVREETSLSFFEFGTLAALDIFMHQVVDIQILEVGLGGRLDAVNSVDADAVLMASIDIDHQDWLGATREAIGYEKAGVFRPGRPAVVSDPEPPASLLQHAELTGTPISCLGRDYRFEVLGDRWNWSGRKGRLLDLPLPGLSGEHQCRNAAGALQLLEEIGEYWAVGEASVRHGLATVRLRGRFELIEDRVPIVIDVAHNPQAVARLAEQLRARFPGRRLHAVFALMRDKDAGGVIDRIGDLIAEWYLPPLPLARASAPLVLAELLHSSGREKVNYAFANVSEAVTAAVRNAGAGDIVVVFGSFFLVAEFFAEYMQPQR